MGRRYAAYPELVCTLDHPPVPQDLGALDDLFFTRVPEECCVKVSLQRYVPAHQCDTEQNWSGEGERHLCAAGCLLLSITDVVKFFLHRWIVVRQLLNSQILRFVVGEA